MKKIIFIALFIILLLFIILIKELPEILSTNNTQNVENNEENIVKEISYTKNNNSVKYNGWLHTDNSLILNEHDEKIQLNGISSHGIQWYSDLITYDNLKLLKEDWNMNIFRIAMYTDPNSSGYISNPEQIKQKTIEAINHAIDLDIYVIVDWHILFDNNPQTYQEQAKEFFNELSNKYADIPNVIYEICNEPNGGTTWNDNIKPYAEEIIPIIRQNSPKSIIIVGTPDWCKDLKTPFENPLKYDNILYAFHFYSGSHGENYRKIIKEKIDNNFPIIVSECGMTDASGNGNLYKNEFKKWIDFLDENDIGWICWSLSNKNEASAILTPEYNTTSIGASGEDSLVNINDYLSESGKYLYDIFKSKIQNI